MTTASEGSTGAGERIETLDLEPIKQRCDAAGCYTREFDHASHADLCAHVREDLPALIAEVERLRTALRGQGVGERIEGWIDHTDGPDRGQWVAFWNLSDPHEGIDGDFRRAILFVPDAQRGAEGEAL